MKGGFNSATTFNPFLSFPGGSGDYWGFGGESRAIPSVIGPDRRLVQGTYTAAELQNFGRSFSDIWEPVKTGSQRPALDWSASGGTSWGKFGIVGALSFSNKPQFRKEQLRYFRLSGGQPLVFSDYPQYDEYGESARMGAVMNFAYRATPNDKIVFRNTWTHDADKTAREFSGLDGATGNETLAQRLRFVERNVLANGVEGEHARPEWANSLIHWQFTYSTSGRNEPDLREVIRARDSDGTYPFVSLTNSGQRFFSDMADRIFEPQFDYSVPFFKGSVTGVFKVGFRGTFRSRDFQARRFRYQPQGALNLLLPGNQLLGDANIRPDGFEIREITRRTDRYEATMDVYAGYAMVDLNFGAKWRVSGGIRIEDATQEVITEDPLIPGAGASTAFLQNRDPAPTVNVVYSLAANQNVRVSYSRTLSRPDFRELSPFDFNNVQGGFVAVGNPNLKRAAIQNFDARWEMFPGGSQLIAASVFAKLFDQPIEQTILASTDLRQSFINAKGAKNYGFELEYRQNLLRFHPGLRDWAISSNLTFVDSNIEIRPEDATVLTSQQRPLLGQSRWVYNGALQWGHAAWNSNAQLSANYVGKRITDVGSFGLPDISQEATTVLDFMFQYKPGENSKWSYRFEAENLTDNDYRWKQGGFLQRQYQLGRTFQIGVNYSFF
jgi:outer membrane receptor protein involved in Fe transport